MKDVIIYNNLVSEEDCNFLIDYINKNMHNKEKFKRRLGISFKKGAAYRALSPDQKAPYLFKDIESILNKYKSIFIQKIKENFDDDKSYFYGFSIARLRKDIKLRLHQDIHHYFCELNYSGVLYLNDNYAGGEIVFLDKFETKEDWPLYEDEMGGLIYKPKKGDFILFPAGKWHGGKTVEKGDRDSIILWTTPQKEYEFKGFDSMEIISKVV